MRTNNCNFYPQLSQLKSRNLLGYPRELTGTVLCSPTPAVIIPFTVDSLTPTGLQPLVSLLSYSLSPWLQPTHSILLPAESTHPQLKRLKKHSENMHPPSKAINRSSKISHRWTVILILINIKYINVYVCLILIIIKFVLTYWLIIWHQAIECKHCRLKGRASSESGCPVRSYLLSRGCSRRDIRIGVQIWGFWIKVLDSFRILHSVNVWRMVPDAWLMTYDMWRMTRDKWLVTHDLWRMTCDVWRVTYDVWRMTCDIT